MSVTKLLAISLGAILTNNFIFSQFLGICPFLGVSKKSDTAVGMGLAVTFVMGLASAFCYGVNIILVKLGLGFLLAIYLFSTVRERLEFADYPKAFEGFPIALITAGLIALAFMGFSGLQVWPM